MAGKGGNCSQRGALALQDVLPAFPLHGGWDEDTIHELLSSFVAGRAQWPSEAEFAQAGLEPLLLAMTRRGGRNYWRKRMGFAASTRGNPKRRHPDDVEREVAEFCAGMTQWPGATAFRQAGKSGLYQAAARHPLGVKGLAAKLGLANNHEQGRGWDDQRIEHEMRELLDGRDHWPTQAEFKAAGRADLMHAIYTHGGHQHWAQRMGMQANPTGIHAKRLRAGA